MQYLMMNPKTLLVFIVLVLMSSTVRSQAVELKIPMPRSKFDISHDYYLKLISKTFQKADPQVPPPKLVPSFPMQQGRAVSELRKSENIDLFWIGTDKAKERNLISVKIPLERGLMGFRRFIIHKDNVAMFDKILSIEDLKSLVACQGTHWPDTKIMRAAGLVVDASPVYEHHFDKVSAKRCDYFPRGFHEGQAEIDQRRGLYPDLVLYQRIILQYPFTVYAFFSREKHAFAEKLERGLRIMLEDGSLGQHMATHPLTAHVFPLHQWKKSLLIQIPNKDVGNTKNSPFADYWLSPGKGSDVFFDSDQKN